MWSNIRNTAKKIGPLCGRKKAYVWDAVLRLMVLANMNNGPYQSQQWFTGKRDAMRKWFSTNTPYSDDFQDIAAALARSRG